MSVTARVKELMREWDTLRFGMSELDAAEAWAESMARHEADDARAHDPTTCVTTFLQSEQAKSLLAEALGRVYSGSGMPFFSPWDGSPEGRRREYAAQGKAILASLLEEMKS